MTQETSAIALDLKEIFAPAGPSVNFGSGFGNGFKSQGHRRDLLSIFEVHQDFPPRGDNLGVTVSGSSVAKLTGLGWGDNKTLVLNSPGP